MRTLLVPLALALMLPNLAFSQDCETDPACEVPPPTDVCYDSIEICADPIPGGAPRPDSCWTEQIEVPCPPPSDCESTLLDCVLGGEPVEHCIAFYEACTSSGCTELVCEEVEPFCETNPATGEEFCSSPMPLCEEIPVPCEPPPPNPDLCFEEFCAEDGCFEVPVECPIECWDTVCEPGADCIDVVIPCPEPDPDPDPDICYDVLCDDAFPGGACQQVEVPCLPLDVCTEEICDPTGACEVVEVECANPDLCYGEICDSTDPATGCDLVPIECPNPDICYDEICSDTGDCIQQEIPCPGTNLCYDEVCDSSDPTMPCSMVEVPCECTEMLCVDGTDACWIDDNGVELCETLPGECMEVPCSPDTCSDTICTPDGSCVDVEVPCEPDLCTDTVCSADGDCWETQIPCDEPICIDTFCNNAGDCVDLEIACESDLDVCNTLFDACTLSSPDPIACDLLLIECAGFQVPDADSDGYTVEEGDCDDNEPDRYPGAPEACDSALDYDCDGLIMPCPDPIDADEDGYDAEVDCDDNDADVYPEAPEDCASGVDSNCDGVIEDCPAPSDDDGDGYTVEEGDCDDSDASVHPDAEEPCGTGIDSNCDGRLEDCPEPTPEPTPVPVTPEPPPAPTPAPTEDVEVGASCSVTGGGGTFGLMLLPLLALFGRRRAA